MDQPESHEMSFQENNFEQDELDMQPFNDGSEPNSDQVSKHIRSEHC